MEKPNFNRRAQRTLRRKSEINFLLSANPATELACRGGRLDTLGFLFEPAKDGNAVAVDPYHEDLNAKARRARRMRNQEFLIGFLRVLRFFAFKNLGWIDRKVLILLSCRPELMCPDERFSRPANRSVRGLFLGESFGTKQNRRKTLRKLMAAIGGIEPGVWVGNTPSWQFKVLGRIAILLFDEGGALQRQREAPACGRRPDSFRRRRGGEKAGDFAAKTFHRPPRRAGFDAKNAKRNSFGQRGRKSGQYNQTRTTSFRGAWGSFQIEAEVVATRDPSIRRRGIIPLAMA